MYSIVDAHCDTAFLLLNKETYSYNFWELNSKGHIDFPRLVRGGVKVQFFAVCTEYMERSHDEHYRMACKMISLLKNTFKENSSELSLALHKSTLQNALRQQKKAAVLAMEGGAPLKGRLELIDHFFDLGIRVFGLTWNQKNSLADGVKVNGAKGLTAFGEKVIKKLNTLGIIIDCAHLAPKGLEEVTCLSRDPIIVSHANAYSLCPHPRNLTDEQLKIISRNKGVVGLTVYPNFIAAGGANLEKLLDHFVHMANVAGTETIGFGSDFDGIKRTLAEIPDVSFYPRLIEGLIGRGFNDNELKQILGKNFLRIINQVWG